MKTENGFCFLPGQEATTNAEEAAGGNKMKRWHLLFFVALLAFLMVVCLTYNYYSNSKKIVKDFWYLKEAQCLIEPLR